ncbi:MAG: bifunctional oligoribonuclease/PAP phosphatase NrnA [Acidobacteriota bacterium]
MIPERLLELLERGQRFVITSHLNPDGDAVGTSLGMARLLRARGRDTRVWLHDPPPPIFAPLDGFDAIHVGPEAPAWLGDRDTAIFFECPTLDRNGLARHLEQLVMLNIDHHLGNSMYGTVNWVEPEAPAVGEMTWRLAEALGVGLDAHTADALYLALETDTGGFRFGNATPQAFEAAAGLVRAGASPERVSQWIHESRSPAALRLLGETLSSLELHREGSIATVWIDRSMFERTGAVPSDTEGLVDYPRSVRGVDAVAFFRELPDGGVKGSLRSRGAIDVESVARAEGGGGHRNAAGFRVAADNRGDLRERIVEALADVLERAQVSAPEASHA